MTDAIDWNARIIDEFRANQGHVGGPFEDAPLLLLHHRGRKSGREHVTPVMYLLAADDPDVRYVFASKNGAPDNPAWYHNLLEAGSASVELGRDTLPVAVRELTGGERESVYAEQARRYPNFGEYEEKTAGIRTIPVLELRRV
ncbi:MAG TPA: nitroreductase family deazaflavin-dependent oxidoreductase [Candidatus Dormibacteraeota bacterium]|jgi:deazaflavin-dependent oxidoreductase (nitroreductase family)|nr:nitroreductase family deazaflavin-dependent oxidoreductase [Candidatus Dormibacteraeota bacterium]